MTEPRMELPKVASENTLYGMDHPHFSHTLSPNHLSPSPSPDFYHEDKYLSRASTSTEHPLLANPNLMRKHCHGPVAGNPGVLALWSFAVVTLLLGTYNGFYPFESNNIILPTAIMFGGLAQYIAGFMCMINGDTFPAILFVSYGAFWAGSGLMMLPSVHGALGAMTDTQISTGNAVYHYLWSAYTAWNIVISLKIKNGTFMTSWNLFFVFLTLLLEGIAFTFTSHIVMRISGITAYLAAIGAFYTGAVELLEDQDEHYWLGHYKFCKHS
ncbi:GPR1/FUN34/yaaH family-domain-containing protein [Gongronella butleri]|nr:GPR1/FUN34/yaaH family-domain-containing protein [Gongronella butleri]